MVEGWAQLYENHVERESSGSLEGQQSAVARGMEHGCMEGGPNYASIPDCSAKTRGGRILHAQVILCPEVVCVLDYL